MFTSADSELQAAGSVERGGERWLEGKFAITGEMIFSDLPLGLLGF